MAAAVPSITPPRCPWYVAAVMGLHYAIGVTCAFFGAVFLIAPMYDVLARSEQYPLLMFVFTTVVAAVLGLIGYALLYSGQCIQRRTRRRYSVLLGAVLCFGGFLAPVGLLTIYALTRPRAVAYYDEVVEERGFPVMPLPPADSAL